MPLTPPPVERVTALGLLIAAFTILVLAIVVVYDVQRETDLNREVIGALQVKEGLESLGTAMHELKYAARVHALTGDPAAAQSVERYEVEIAANLDYVVTRAQADATLAATTAQLAEGVKAFGLHMRVGARAIPSESEAIETAAWAALERSLVTQTQRINEGSVAQIRVGENLKFYVTLLLVGSVCVLAGLFAIFQHSHARARHAQARIEHLAHYDPLTNLPNRTLLNDRFAQEVIRAKRGEQGFAVALFDLDGFKSVNDSYGHAAGDTLLGEVGRRARMAVRASDTVGRIGGDEFLAILPGATRENAIQVAEKLRSELEKPYLIAGHSVEISASVGVSLFPEHGEDPDQLFRAADAALYAAKREGRNLARLAT
ncbi:GGDEF domain-containing protein [Usitatibacter palustris]|uniref:GGDEF domain-containing protein n=1 Tax=Usitatibacter palustris TaxID=2732487 RepID=A0A6M4H1A7_9PROT|nr:GGDEF domain-containing protein [Usitatibacter palustris]QJR13250.1 hypothetical protein DSM104440_00032 [Usitatibacter palustris]